MALDPEVALEFFRLKARISIVEGLVLKLHILLPLVSSPADSELLRESLAATLQVLEEAAETGRQVYLADPDIVAHDVERVQYAEEFREIVESMRARVARIGEDIARR